jgi:hypothetical protein
MLFISVLAMMSAISISVVAAYYSIIGLTAIFPSSVMSIIIMGAVLEVGKISSAVWLHTFWDKASFLLKTYLTTAVIILMFITSLGIFGFLSKSHIEHTSSLSSNVVIIQNINAQISREEQRIENSMMVMSQMDEAVNVLTEAQRIRGPEGALAVRELQREERELINIQIEESNDRIQRLIEQRSELEIQQASVEAEVGPIRYIAELVYGPNPDNTLLEEAVRWLIILIVVVFDPLAITLVLASISGFKIRKSTMVEKQVLVSPQLSPQPIAPKKRTPRKKIVQKNDTIAEISTTQKPIDTTPDEVVSKIDISEKNEEIVDVSDKKEDKTKIAKNTGWLGSK